MKTERLAIVLTVVNLAILMFNLSDLRAAKVQGGVPVLRGRALEIVDERGKVRAQIAVLPPGSMPDGQKYPETTLLRLIDPNGRPGVKIGASTEGSGVSFAGDSERREWNGVQILAEGAGSSVILTNKDGRTRSVKP